MEEALDILAFASHPDDAEIGCGGSLILAAQQGLRVAVADLSKAEHSTQGDQERRQQEVAVATKQLGLVQRFNLGLPDTRIGADPHHRDPLIQLIRQTRPRIVLAPFWHDRHPDHAATGRLVKDAFFFAGVASIGDGKPFRPASLYFYMLHHPFEPSFVIDISSAWLAKMAAIEAFASQFKPDDNDRTTMISQPDFMRFIEARAIYFGALIGGKFGEAFYSAGPIKLPGFPGLDRPVPPSDGLSGYSVFSP